MAAVYNFSREDIAFGLLADLGNTNPHMAWGNGLVVQVVTQPYRYVNWKGERDIDLHNNSFLTANRDVSVDWVD